MERRGSFQILRSSIMRILEKRKRRKLERDASKSAEKPTTMITHLDKPALPVREEFIAEPGFSNR